MTHSLCSSLQEALVYTAVAVEVLCWFFVGEMIGRWSWQGYTVPGSYVHPDKAAKAKKMKEEYLT